MVAKGCRAADSWGDDESQFSRRQGVHAVGHDFALIALAQVHAPAVNRLGIATQPRKQGKDRHLGAQQMSAELIQSNKVLWRCRRFECGLARRPLDPGGCATNGGEQLE